MTFLIKKRRFFYLEKILKSFIETCSNKRGEVKAEIQSAKELSSDEIKTPLFVIESRRGGGLLSEFYLRSARDSRHMYLLYAPSLYVHKRRRTIARQARPDGQHKRLWPSAQRVWAGPHRGSARGGTGRSLAPLALGSAIASRSTFLLRSRMIAHGHLVPALSPPSAALLERCPAPSCSSSIATSGRARSTYHEAAAGSLACHWARMRHALVPRRARMLWTDAASERSNAALAASAESGSWLISLASKSS